MHTHQEIKFKSTPSTSKLTADKVCYQGQVIHNRTLDPEETRAAFADFTQLLKPPLSDLAIDSVASFVADEIAKGNRLDFGAFSVGLKMRGGLPAANAPFDPKANALSVEITPGKKLQQAVRYLKPVNVTDVNRSDIIKALQLTPYELQDAFVATGTRTLVAYGTYIGVNPDATGEGVWIENDADEKLLKGRILAGCDICTCRFELTGDVAPGLYWLAICSRQVPNGPLLRCRRRITAIATPPLHN